MNSDEANKAFDVWWLEQSLDLTASFSAEQVACVQKLSRWAFAAGIVAELQHEIEVIKT